MAETLSIEKILAKLYLCVGNFCLSSTFLACLSSTYLAAQAVIKRFLLYPFSATNHDFYLQLMIEANLLFMEKFIRKASHLLKAVFLSFKTLNPDDGLELPEAQTVAQSSDPTSEKAPKFKIYYTGLTEGIIFG